MREEVRLFLVEISRKSSLGKSITELNFSNFNLNKIQLKKFVKNSFYPDRKLLNFGLSIALSIGFLVSPVFITPASAAGVGDVTDAMIYGPTAPIGTLVAELSGQDDDTENVSAPFAINFFGQKKTALCISTNGVVYPLTDISDLCNPRYDKNLEKLALGSDLAVIAAVATDIDLGERIDDGTTTYTGTNSDGFGKPTNIYFGSTTIGGRDAVVITWYRVGFNDRNFVTDGVEGSVTFQIVLIKRPTGNDTTGFDFDIQFNMGTLTLASDGYKSTNGNSGCDSNKSLDPEDAEYDTCRWGVGISNYTAGTPETADPYELFPDTSTRLLIDDGGATALVRNSLNSDVAGRYEFAMVGGVVQGFSKPSMGGSGSNGGTSFPWVGEASTTCSELNPGQKQLLVTANKIKPRATVAKNIVGKNISKSDLNNLGNSKVIFDTQAKTLKTATTVLPRLGCSDHMVKVKTKQPIQFIVGGFTLQSSAQGYLKSPDGRWHNLSAITLIEDTAAFLYPIQFTKKGTYVVVLTQQPAISEGKTLPVLGFNTARFKVEVSK